LSEEARAMLKARIREPVWLACDCPDGHIYHLNWIAVVEDETGAVIDLAAQLGEAIFMAAHCIDGQGRAWAWGTWWGEAAAPILRRGEASSLGEAQHAAIAAGLQMAERALNAGRI
jgi:hypothetical protein